MLLLILAVLGGHGASQNQVADIADRNPPVLEASPSIQPPLDFVDLGGEGVVRLTCHVTVEGRARDCSVVSETPEDMGLGAATLAASVDFQFRPATVSGVAVEDEISFNVRFRVSDSETALRPEGAVQASPDMQKAVRVFDHLGYISGLCSTFLSPDERGRLEAGFKRLKGDQKQLPVFDQVLFGAYGRSRFGDVAQPMSEEHCTASLGLAREGVEEASELIAAVEASLPPTARRR
jgi:TonB family protein